MEYRRKVAHARDPRFHNFHNNGREKLAGRVDTLGLTARSRRPCSRGREQSKAVEVVRARDRRVAGWGVEQGTVSRGGGRAIAPLLSLPAPYRAALPPLSRGRAVVSLARTVASSTLSRGVFLLRLARSLSRRLAAVLLAPAQHRSARS